MERMPLSLLSSVSYLVHSLTVEAIDELQGIIKREIEVCSCAESIETSLLVLTVTLQECGRKPDFVIYPECWIKDGDCSPTVHHKTSIILCFS